MVRTYKKKKKQYNEVTIAVAINEVMAGSSIKRTLMNREGRFVLVQSWKTS